MSQEPEIIGDWFRERILGSGAFGIVSLWKHSKTQEKIAIKKYRGDPSTNLSSKQKERWTKEVEMMKNINNENIVNFKPLPPELGKELNKYNMSKLPMLSMEYCEGGDLRSVLSKAENCCGLPESDVRNALFDLANAVSYLHSLGITHRDLKPENVVLHPISNRLVCKLIDLGYAKEIDAASVSASLVGTIQYLAPEFFYSKTYSCSVDYWSLGLVAFELCCGSRPFLPNMSPAQWIRHVQEKKHEDICIWQEENGNIRYNQEIWLETHISPWLRENLSKWLQNALEYNPKKRGYDSVNDSNVDLTKPTIFNQLTNILEQKIISIFCIPLVKFFYYQIDEFTLILTVLGWIERDTKLDKNQLIIFNGSSEKVDNERLAIEFFNKSYTMDPMLYIFKKNEILKSEMIPEIPSLVRNMLENLGTMPYFFQKRAYAQSLYFIFSENRFYNTLLDAIKIKLGFVKKNFDNLKKNFEKVKSQIEYLIQQKEFSEKILKYDFEQYLKNFLQDANFWKESFKKICNEIEKMNEIKEKLAKRFDSVNRRILGVINEEENKFSKFTQHGLDKMLNEALDLYRNLKKKPQEKRSKSESCQNMVKILYTTLKVRSNLYKDKNFTLYQQKILDLQLEIEKISEPLKTSLEHIEKIKSDLFNDTLKRQSLIWELTIKPKNQNSVYQTIKTKLTNSIDEEESNEKSLTEVFNISNESIKLNNFEQPTIAKSEPKPIFKIGQENDYGEPISLKEPIHFILGPVENSITGLNQTQNQGPSSCGTQTSPEKNKKIIENCSKSVPTFLIGANTRALIHDNQNLRFELQEKTNESFLRCKSILNENLDFSFLNE